MGDLIVALLPYIIGSALVPVQIILVILLLKSPAQGLLKGAAFLAGMTAVRILQGVFFGLILTGEADAAAGEAGGKGPIASTLLLVLGILLLVNALRYWNKEDDLDSPPPRWFSMIDDLNLLKTFGIGLALPLISPKMWVFTLSAITTISAAQPGQPAGALGFLLFLLLAQSLLLLPVLIRLVLPTQSMSLLEGISAWLTRYNTPIVMVVSLVFGLMFLYQGASGLFW